MALGHPILISPGVIQVPDDGGGAGRSFKVKAESVRLIHPVILLPGADVVFITGSMAYSQDKPFPDTGLAPGT
jgi:hypothetical protein